MKKRVLRKRIFAVLIAIMLSFCQLSLASAAEIDAKTQGTETSDEGVKGVETGISDNIREGNAETALSKVLDESITEEVVQTETSQDESQPENNEQFPTVMSKPVFASEETVGNPPVAEGQVQMAPDPSDIIIEGNEVFDEVEWTGKVSYGDISSPPLPADQRKAIMALYEDRIMVGYNNAFYGPFDNVIREDVVCSLWRAAGSPEPKNSKSPFKDAGTFNEYGKAIQWAYEKNITKGFADGTFRPKAPCTRGQLITFLWRYKGSPDVKVSRAPFKDVSAKHSFCRQIIWASKNGIANGYTDKTFKPGKYCNRAQCATFIYRMLNM